MKTEEEIIKKMEDIKEMEITIRSEDSAKNHLVTLLKWVLE